MRSILRLACAVACFFVASSCDSDVVGLGGLSGGAETLRVVNAFTTPVDVLVDGQVVIQGLAAASVAKASTSLGNHTLVLRSTANGGSVSQSITSSNDALNTFAAVRLTTGAVGSAALDDTGSVVPAGATKLRVIHFAPNAGELQVYRTQPDFQTPVAWQFPFTYQAQFNSLSAPFYQSTVGTWEVHIWQTPANSSGWASAPVKVLVPLGSGEKKTIVILDNPAGGVRVELI
jgi:hypothetical protein